MFQRRSILGVGLGLVTAFVILSFWPAPDADPYGISGDSSGRIFSECDGTIRELVIHFEPGSIGIVRQAYRDLLQQLPAEVLVHVVCPDAIAWETFQAEIGPAACRLQSIIVNHPITTWARDRWVACGVGPDAGEGIMLWASRQEQGADRWPARAGDQRVAGDLAQRLRDIMARHSELHFDGGDFVSDDATVFVVPPMVRRNLQHTVADVAELTSRLEHWLGKRVVLLEPAPEHHGGMFMMVAGQRTLLVGDPAWGQRLLAQTPDAPMPCPPEGPDFSDETMELFAAVARQGAAAGYRIVRIPTVPGRNGRAYLTFVNVLIDQRDGKRTVYLPRYEGYAPLNAAAAQVWESLGYSVRPVNCTDVYPHFGSLHCLVNVLKREPAR